MTEMRNLSVVIPSYNARTLLRRTLRTLAVAAPDCEVIVVDGASRDGSAEMVRSEFPRVRLLRHENHGFAHAINRGLESATQPYLLLLNSDLFVTRAALETMLDRLAADRKLAAVSPVLLNEDGTRQHVFGWPFGAFYWPNFFAVKKPSRVPLITAACLMTRRDVLRDVGGLDESFFLYNEEYDWCTRVHRAGYHIELIPETVVHVGGGSTSHHPSLWLEAQRGFAYFTKKHGTKMQSELLRRAMQFQGFCYRYTDPRPEHRAMWETLRSMMEREAYLESPFPLSGRGNAPALPRWAAMQPAVMAAQVAAPSKATATRDRQEPITARHPIGTHRGPIAIGQEEAAPVAMAQAEVEPSASVVRLAAERLRIASRRSAKVAAAR